MDDDRDIERQLLAKWISQRDKLNRLIDGLREEIGEEIASSLDIPTYENTSSPVAPRQVNKAPIVPGEFFGLSQTDATAKYLNKIGHAVHLDTILDALKIGGVKFSGKDPKNNLYTVLVRGTRRFVLVSPSTFGLVEFYPARSKVDKERKPRKKRRKRRKVSKSKQESLSSGKETRLLSPP